MPFTPLHMGAGIAVKAVLRNRFSLVVFGGSQIIMDIQPLIVLLGYKAELHGLTHTIFGAALIALFCGLTGKPIGELFLRLIQWPKQRLISWRVSFISAFIGTYSHIALDSIMHSDVTLWLPFTSASPLYGIISVKTLHILCWIGVVVGGVAYYLPR